MDVNRKRLMENIGLCRRAGKLIIGFEAVKESARDQKAKLILVAADASERTKRHVQAFARDGNPTVWEIPIVMAQLTDLLHKPAVVLGVTDAGLSGLLLSLKPTDEKTIEDRTN